MPARNEIQKILEQNRGAYVSGQDLALALGVSRSAVNKAIKELRREGFLIDAVTNNGYRLSEESDVISAAGIKAFLDADSPVGEIFVYDSLPSTNLTAKRLALDGAGAGTVVAACRQTDGRGRMGRSFFSPEGGIYMSIILRPQITAEKGALLTTAASVAVCRAIENYLGIYPKIKWVNDILFNGKKICGISTEALTGFETASIEHVVIGIGINLRATDFPPEISQTAGSLLREDEKGPIRNRLIAQVLNEIFRIMPGLGSASFMDEYRKRLAVLGRDIRVIRNNETIMLAKAVDIDHRGGLIVETEDGTRQLLSSEEISIRGDFLHGEE